MRREAAPAPPAAGDTVRIVPTRSVVIAACAFALVYVALDLNKLYALRYGADTGTFVQFLSGEAHGRGSWNGAEYRPHLQVHDSWALLALVPLLAVFPFAQTLLVLQVLAIAGAALALCAFARACGAERRGASAVAIAYLLSPSAQGIAYGNFLENAFVPLLAALGALAVRRRALVASLLVAQLLLGLKEDQVLFLIWFGLACALWWDRRIGASIAALALLNGVAFVVAERLARAQPSLPGYALQVDDPLGKAVFFAALLAPFAFAPLLLRRRLLLAAPLVAELVLARPWAYPIARIGTHWTASCVAATALAAACVVAQRPRLATPVLVCAALCALALNDTVLKPGRWPFVVDRAAYARAAALRASARTVTVRRPDEGTYAVAAANPHVVLARYRPDEPGYCPAYNTTRARSSPRSASARGRPERSCAAGSRSGLVSEHDEQHLHRVEAAVRDHRGAQRAAAAVDPGQHDPARAERGEGARVPVGQAEGRAAQRRRRPERQVAPQRVEDEAAEDELLDQRREHAGQQREAGDQERVVRAGQQPHRELLGLEVQQHGLQRGDEQRDGQHQHPAAQPPAQLGRPGRRRPSALSGRRASQGKPSTSTARTGT